MQLRMWRDKTCGERDPREVERSHVRFSEGEELENCCPILQVHGEIVLARLVGGYSMHGASGITGRITH